MHPKNREQKRVTAAGTAILLAMLGAAGVRAELRELRPGHWAACGQVS